MALTSPVLRGAAVNQVDESVVKHRGDPKAAPVLGPPKGSDGDGPRR